MGHMVVGLREDTRWTKMIQSKVVDLWIHLTGQLTLMVSIPTLVLRDIIDIISNILIGGVRGGTF